MTHFISSGSDPEPFVLPSPGQARESFRPVLLDPARADGAAALAVLRDSPLLPEVHDRIEDQVAELLRCRAPGEVLDGRPLERAVAGATDGRPDTYGRWAWYPWSGGLVHVLPEAEFRQVRTDRNRDKITREQQQGLLRRRIGVIGLSVGSSAALACALEGVGGAFRLADFDRLSLSNLNRLGAGVHDLGTEKSVLCARPLYELDPYLDIEVHRGGVTEETVADFFGGGDDDGDTLVGTMGLLVEGYGSNAMLTSLVLLPGAPMRGHGHEAGRLLMAYGFGPLGLHRIWAGHRSDHHVMPQVMHAAGLRPEATLRQLFRTQGCWHDVTTYAAVAPEWKRQATPRELAILDGAPHLDRV